MKTYLLTFFFFLLVTQTSFAQLELSSSVSKSDYHSLKLSNFSFDIDSLITTTMNNYHIPGLSACLVRDGEIIWKGAYGYADIENNKPVTDSTLFMIASLSKPFTGTALMQLWEADLFELDDNINDYLNEFQVHIPNHYNDTITFRMLLTHTSSIDDNWTVLDNLTFWGGDSPVPLDSFLINYFTPGGIYYNTALNFVNSAPGTVYHYSNIGVTLVAYLVETLSNIPFEQYCQDSLFSPLGMNETSWFLSNLDTNHIALPYYYSGGNYHSYGHYGFPIYPAAGLRTSAAQLACLIIAFMEKGQIDGNRILDSSTVDLMTTVQFPELNSVQAIIWGIYDYTVPGFGTYTFCGHGGSFYGVKTGMDYTLETDKHVGVIILTNGESQDGVITIWDALYVYSNTISTDVEDTEQSPSEFSLSQNFPNPFNPATTINYQIPELSFVTLKVYDVLGNEIITLVNEEKTAGSYDLEFNAASLSSGVYFYRLQAGSFVETKKMVLMK